MKTLAFALGLACIASTAHADPLPIHLDGRGWLDVQGRFGFLQGSGDASAWCFAPRVDVLIPINPSSGVLLQWGLAYASVSAGTLDESGSDSRLAVDNLFAGYALALGSNVRFTPGLVLPLASVSDDNLDDAVAEVVTYALVGGAAGLHELWLYLPETFAIVLPLALHEPLSGDDVWLESRVAGALLFPSSDVSNDDLELYIDLEIALRASIARIAIGSGWIPTQDHDNAVVTASLGVVFPAGRGHIHADVMFTLDEPRFFDDGAIPSFALGYTTPL
ncbi:MAG: hypothetical protein U1F43_16255 [Myxococcota bacterium]